MDAQAIKQAIDAIESATDKAVAALKNGTPSSELQQAVNDLHQQARTKRNLDDQQALTQAALDIEKAADRAVAASRQGGDVDAALKQAIQDVHTQASQLKHKVQGATA